MFPSLRKETYFQDLQKHIPCNLNVLWKFILNANQLKLYGENLGGYDLREEVFLDVAKLTR